MANMKDVAKATGLSLATVSRVFNESDKVTDKTRKIVQKAAEKLNYRPNKMAAALRSGKSKTIGVVVPIIDNSVFSAAIKSMEEALSEAGYNIIICQSHESLQKEIEIFENLKQLHVDGIVISVSKETNNIAHIQDLKDAGVAVVLFDRTLEIGKVNSIVINNYNGAYQATKHLVTQGCKKVIHLAGKESVTIFRERCRGFEAALIDSNLLLNGKSIIPFDDGTPEGIQELKEAMLAKDRPDGIFAHGDISALVALRIMNELQIRVPEEVAIIGFGDSSFCSYINPGLSSVNQRNEDVGKLTAAVLLEELKREEKDRVFTQQMLPPELMIRASSMKT